MASNSLLHLLELVTIFFIVFHSKTCVCVKQKALILPLKTQKSSLHHATASLKSAKPRQASSFSSSSTGKVSFQHNVTLTVSLSVGSPPQNVSMILDTASGISWLRCKKHPDFDKIFNPNASSSYAPITCSSPTCRARTRDLPAPASCDPNRICHVAINYADSSSVEGTLASEIFRIGAESRLGTLFGCMDVESSTQPIEDAKTTGLMGMNQGSLSFVKQMGLSQFSYCISGSNSSGVLLLGEASFPWLKPLNYTRLVNISRPLPYFDRLAYTVQPVGIKVSGKVLPIPKSAFVPDHTGAGQTMIDSGTQFSFVMGPVYTALKNEFLAQTKGVLRVLNEPGFIFQGTMDLCYLVESSRASLPELPSVTWMFEGAEMSVSGETLLYRVPDKTRGNDSVYCFTFGNSDLLGFEAFVIGNHHQQNVWVEFDLEKSRMGFGEVSCDLASQRLGL